MCYLPNKFTCGMIVHEFILNFSSFSSALSIYLLETLLVNTLNTLYKYFVELTLLMLSTHFFSVLCPGGYSAGVTSSNSSVIQDENSFWHVQHTVPYLLIAVFFPLCSVRSPTFFTKFNSLGKVILSFCDQCCLVYLFLCPQYFFVISLSLFSLQAQSIYIIGNRQGIL